jgi:phage gpG-like protein
MDIKSFKKKLLTDIKIEVEFERNFERKAFFSKPWTPRKSGHKGSLLLVSGRLRSSLKSTVTDEGIKWTSSLPYADIHNQGGEIMVTAKMKRFFWAKYYELSGKIKYRKDGKKSKTSQTVSDEATFYKNMALMKVGSKITIPQRQFIGDAPEVKQVVEKVVAENMVELEKYLLEILKN